MFRINKNWLKLSVLALSVLCFGFAKAANLSNKNNDDYLRVITERADKIVTTLGITDSSEYYKVRSIIVDQYRFINTYHEEKDASIKALKGSAKLDKSEIEAKVKKVEQKAESELKRERKRYVSKLSKLVTANQIEQIKDGMTYGVLPNTYRAYQEMLPNLTAEQKKQILEYLTEAREHAVSAPSSKQKHAWFGKYKGRINNYLSAQGIDMKKASLEWEERVRKNKK